MEITERTITHFTSKFFALMDEKYGGEISINALRIMNRVYSETAAGRHTTHGELVEFTGIGKSTVSRTVASLIESGWLQDERDPSDRRRWAITIGPTARKRRSSDWQRCIDWINESSE